MRRYIEVCMAVILLLGASIVHGQWKMYVHESDTTTEFTVSEIDSVTFHLDLGPDVIEVPSGSFDMGDASGGCVGNGNWVTLTRDFYLGRCEVTNQEYMEALQWAYDQGYVTADVALVSDNMEGSNLTLLELEADDSEIQFDGAGQFYLRESPSSFAQNAYPDGYDPAIHPVKGVTWYGAAAYCDWLSLQAGLPRAYDHSGDWSCNGEDPYGAEGYRLPTDAEWEYAARYGHGDDYPWGPEDPDCSRANFEYYTGYCVGWTSPVGSYPAGNSVLGMSDLAGNVSEWCNDRFVCDIGDDPLTDPVGPPSGYGRLVRGGFWGDVETSVSSMARNEEEPDLTAGGLGFRVARTVDP
jgi:formylglycine-generating enzyme required for sulfatase activity